MGLDVVQKQKLDVWLREKGIRPLCGVCAATNWVPGDIVTAPVYSGGDTVIGGPVIPMVQVVCGQCGYVMQFSAKLMGLV